MTERFLASLIFLTALSAMSRSLAFSLMSFSHEFSVAMKALSVS
jgi:hypothetical protein